VSVAESSKNEKQKLDMKTHNEIVPLRKPFPKVVGLIILNEFCERYYFMLLFFSIKISKFKNYFKKFFFCRHSYCAAYLSKQVYWTGRKNS
jgi:hypothetical protein